MESLSNLYHQFTLSISSITRRLVDIDLSQEIPLRSEIYTRDELAKHAKILAERQRVVSLQTRTGEKLRNRFWENTKFLELAYFALAEAAKNKEMLTPGAEWLLDNFHVIREQVKDMRRLLPEKYYRRLPKLSDGPYKDFPRVYELALEYIGHTDAVVNEDLLSCFVGSFQESATLTIGELWAVPIMLRLALIENLRRLAAANLAARARRNETFNLIQEIIEDDTLTPTDILLVLASRLREKENLLVPGSASLLRSLRGKGVKAALAVQWIEERLREQDLDANELTRSENYAQAANQISTGNTITSLQALSSLNWSKWFEGISKVDAILRKDILSIYQNSDFLTRDRCRKVIEKLAHKLEISEVDIAEKLIDFIEMKSQVIMQGDPNLAQLQSVADTEQRYLFVGYYLIDEGLYEFESKLAFEPDIFESYIRQFKKHALPVYLTSLLLCTAVITLLLQTFLLEWTASPKIACLLSLLFLIPASEMSTQVIQWLIAKILPPSDLAKYNFSKGIKEEFKTAVTVHTIFSDKLGIEKAVEALEVRYLANADKQLLFTILADLPAGSQASLPQDSTIVEYAKELIDKLNTRYSEGGVNPFNLLFRKRVWNVSEQVFMGWERKRGKVEEFNKLLLGSELSNTTFELICGNLEDLQKCRFVITLDGDSSLPRGIAQKLVATLAHPLNRPVIDSAKRIVKKGYAIIQPRVSTSLPSANISWFSWVFAGDTGVDPYTNTISEVYQDLFEEASYVGKAIYDVKAFSAVLAMRVPPDSLLSHDLFEGLFARVGFASDIEIIDDTPSKYNVHINRQHRWVRGDWQLLPWVFSRVPDAERQTYKSPFSSLGRWKLFDNLRRSLVCPSIFIFILLAWLFVPVSAWRPIYFVGLFALVPIFSLVFDSIFNIPFGYSLSVYIQNLSRRLFRQINQVLLLFCFLPHNAYVMLHAIVITVYRVYFSKKRLLEWMTADQAEKKLGLSLEVFLQHMAPALIISLLAWIFCSIFGPLTFVQLAPFILIWCSAPYVAFWISQVQVKGVAQILAADREYLNQIAWDTWQYFDQNLNSEHNYLIPDNVQLIPNRVVAGRTSPTNIGLSMLAAVSAFDFGFSLLAPALNRLEKIFDSVNKLEKFQGHLLNWYNTRTLESLYPRYISFVDSGNYVASLVALRSSLKEFYHAPLMTDRHQSYILKLLGDLKNLLSNLDPKIAQNIAEASRLCSCKLNGFDSVGVINSALVNFGDFIASRGEQWPGLSTTSVKQLNIILSELNKFSEVGTFVAWYSYIPKFESMLQDLGNEILEPDRILILRRMARLKQILKSRVPTLTLLAKINQRLWSMLIAYENLFKQDQYKSLVSKHPELSNLFSQCKDGLTKSTNAIEQVAKKLDSLSMFCTQGIKEVDFKFLYNFQKNLFSIGYNVDDARMDLSHYDLLASEARLGSLLAIALDAVPQKHWFSMRRSIANSPGGKLLISWSGTMFEYLMPLLLTKNFPGTILSHTYSAVVKAQIAYGRRRSVPWGVSESGYSGVDFEKTYQYKAFGVPGLGLKRGLSEDLVISPYSTFLALPIEPVLSLENLRRLEREGGRGEYGFFESIDYTPSRLSEEEHCNVVQSFFCHHQGMSLVSISNVLHKGIFQNRFHADPVIKATELVLHEKFPEQVSAYVPHQAEVSLIERQEDEERASRREIYNTPHTEYPRTRVLSNGNYSLIVDNAGSGYSFVDRNLALTRWREDSICNDYGYYTFARDREKSQVWSTTYQPTRVEPENYEVIFSPDKIEFRRRDYGIGLHTEITISPESNAEIRRVTVTNITQRKRYIELTSFAEVVLAPVNADTSHPAFSKMFVQSEFVQEFDALIFTRRPRSRHETRHFMLHMLTMPVCWEPTQFETSRPNFIGRGRDIHCPDSLYRNKKLSQTVGSVLDPVMSLRTCLEISPGTSTAVNFITAYAQNRKDILHLAELYHDLHSVQRAFEMSWSKSNVELRHEHFTISQTHTFQHLANALLCNVPKLRGTSEAILKNRLSQSGFWRFGVSGDNPIVLLRVNDPAQKSSVQEIILAHEYLRLRGIVFDILILNEYPGGYLQDFQNELESLVRSGPSGAWVERHGGIYLRSKAQMSEDEITLVQALARVVVAGGEGALSAHLNLSTKSLESVLNRASVEKRIIADSSVLDSRYSPKTIDLEFANDIGGFADNGRAYVLNVNADNLPPQPWSNVIANKDFGFLVTESGGGYTWSGNSRENRLTPWSNDPVRDPLGEAIFIRDIETGKYWSPTPGPVKTKNNYQVKHAFGYSSFSTRNNEVFSDLYLTASVDKKVKWWNLKLSNGSNQPKKLEIFLYLEWVLGVFREVSARTVITAYDPIGQFLFAENHYNNEFAGRVAFVGSSARIQNYSGSRREFLGRHGDLSAPLFLERTTNASITKAGFKKSSLELSNKTGAGTDPAAILKLSINLEPREEKDILLYLAEASTLEEARQLATNYSNIKTQAEEFEISKNYWKNITESIEIKTPERSFDIMMNGWLMYQNLSCRIFARTGFYQSGGAFGFRDQLQDSVALSYQCPEITRNQILIHAARQFVEGDVQHWWHPPTGRGVRTRISDDYLWLPYVVQRYLEVTGDMSLLEQKVPYIEGEHLDEEHMEKYIVPHESQHSASIYEHCIIALDRSLKFGARGLPLIGAGDWNDGMNEVGVGGKGESVWLAWFLYDILIKFSEIVKLYKDTYRTNLYLESAEKLRKSIEDNAWDGKWYRRGFFDDGKALGSKDNDECQIDSISQSWGVISGAAEKSRASMAMTAVMEQLVKPSAGIICLLTPPFDQGTLEPGYIKGYLPGVRENGGQYTHAATWVIMAYALLGQGNKASELFKLINPIEHTKNYRGVERYQGEPYVTCGDVYSCPPFVGRAGWSWYTGSAGWLYRVGLENIIGLKMFPDGFEVSPCIPSSWKNFEFNFDRNEINYVVQIDNSLGVERGVKEVYLDKKLLDGSRIKFGAPKAGRLSNDTLDKRSRFVKIVMG